MRIRKAAALPLIALTALALVSCGTQRASRDDPLQGTSWTLSAYRKSSPIPGTTITLSFTNGEVRGSAGCNHYFGDYHLDGRSLALGPLTVTEMACAEPKGVLEQELAYLELLASVSAQQIDDQGRLILTAGHETLTFMPGG